MTVQHDVAEVLELERRLQTAGCRTDPECLLSLLAEDFVEIGASGTVWDRQSILEMLAQESTGDNVIEVQDLTGRTIHDGIVVTHWISVRGVLRARRTSVWRKDPSGWRIVHHQGTRIS